MFVDSFFHSPNIAVWVNSSFGPAAHESNQLSVTMLFQVFDVMFVYTYIVVYFFCSLQLSTQKLKLIFLLSVITRSTVFGSVRNSAIHFCGCISSKFSVELFGEPSWTLYDGTLFDFAIKMGFSFARNLDVKVFVIG